MTPIQATDKRMIPIPKCDVWNILSDVASYPTWWPRSVGMTIIRLEPDLIGSEIELRPFGGKPFRCRIQSIEAPNKIQMEYLGGFIEGRGEWRLESVTSVTGATEVVYDLDVRAKGKMVAWIGWLLPLPRIHSFQMKHVLQNLERVLQQKKAETSIQSIEHR